MGATLGANGWEVEEIHGSLVRAVTDPVTGGIGISAGGRKILPSSAEKLSACRRQNWHGICRSLKSNPLCTMIHVMPASAGIF